MPDQTPPGTAAAFPLTYSDAFGTAEVSCQVDGHGLAFELREHTFRGRAFNVLETDGMAMVDLPADQYPVDKWGDLVAKFTLTLPIAILGSREPTGQLRLEFDRRKGRIRGAKPAGPRRSLTSRRPGGVPGSGFFSPVNGPTKTGIGMSMAKMGEFHRHRNNPGARPAR